jgi:hypothetical protein
MTHKEGKAIHDIKGVIDIIFPRYIKMNAELF